MCQLNYFVGSQEINVTLKPQSNSSIPPGTQLSRGIYTNPEGGLYNPFDLGFDAPLILLGTAYYLVDCDFDTREYLRRNNVNGFDLSTSSVMTLDNSKMSTYDDWGKFHSKRNENKTFMEAMLGNSVNNHGREGFLRFGTNVLKFKLRKHETSIDDIVQEFSLVYHLADDTVEVFALGDYNGNRNGFSKLLRRSKLPRVTEVLSINRDASAEPAYYHWTDFHIGLVLNVYNRQLRIIDADSYSRSVYESIDCTLGPSENIEEPSVVVLEREIPPPTGFGSEEDSLRSCVGSLQARPPAVKTFGENKSYNFKAKLLNGGVDDVDRDFVFSYYFLDATAKVTEPPKRNSGFLGGVFLSRRKIKLSDGTELSEKHLFIGSKIALSHQIFLLTDSDSRTLQLMEEAGSPKANINLVLNKIRGVLLESVKNGSLYERFHRIEGRHPGLASKDTLMSILSTFDLLGDGDNQLCEHEVTTILRAFAISKDETFVYTSFLHAISPEVNETPEN